MMSSEISSNRSRQHLGMGHSMFAIRLVRQWGGSGQPSEGPLKGPLTLLSNAYNPPEAMVCPIR